MMRASSTLLALAAVLAAQTAAARTADRTIFGVWANPSHSVRVEIKPCRDSVCGVVVWASPEAQRVAAEAGTDPLVGVQLLSDYHAAGPGAWEGTMFVPDLKGQYSSQMELVGPATIEISGCALGRVLCKTQTWTKVASPKAAGTRATGRRARS